MKNTCTGKIYTLFLLLILIVSSCLPAVTEAEKTAVIENPFFDDAIFNAKVRTMMRIINLESMFTKIANELLQRLQASPLRDWQGTFAIATDIGNIRVNIESEQVSIELLKDQMLPAHTHPSQNWCGWAHQLARLHLQPRSGSGHLEPVPTRYH